jgi:DNA-binding NarL/FixJ family response regulator
MTNTFSKCISIIKNDYLNNYKEDYINVLEQVFNGYTNKKIAENMSFSIKSIEAIFTKLLRKNNIFTKNNPMSEYINPRNYLLATGLQNKYIELHSPQNQYPVLMKDINDALFQTLILSSCGLSNNTIANLLFVSPKTIESRLSNLFLKFHLNVEDQNIYNPRILLTSRALSHRIIKADSLRQIQSLFDFENWQNTQNKAIDISNKINDIRFEEMYISSNSNIKSVLDTAMKYQIKEKAFDSR